MPEEPNTKDAAIADWFPKAFRLFGIDHGDQTLDQLDGAVDGVLLLNVRWMTGDRLVSHKKKMTPHLLNNRRTKLGKTSQQRGKDHVGKV